MSEAIEKTTDEITAMVRDIVFDLCRKYLGGEEPQFDKINLQRLPSEDENDVTVNAFYGMKLVGNINISIDEDFDVTYRVVSEFNDE